MNNVAYISGSIGKAILINPDNIVLFTESQSTYRKGTSLDISLFLSQAIEIKTISPFNESQEKLLTLLEIETEKWEALRLTIQILSGEFNENDFKSSLLLLESYFNASKINSAFVENRLLGSKCNPFYKLNEVISICNSLELKNLCKLFKNLDASKSSINKLITAFNHCVFKYIYSEKGISELTIAMLDSGGFKAFVESLNSRSGKEFESNIIIYSKNNQIKEFLASPQHLFKEIELFLIENYPNTFEEIRNEPTNLETETEIDPIINLIDNYFIKSEIDEVNKLKSNTKIRKKKLGTDALGKINSQIIKIESHLAKGQLSEAQKITLQIIEYQISNSTSKHIVKTFCHLSSIALRYNYLGFAKELLIYCHHLDIVDPVALCQEAELLKAEGKHSEALSSYRSTREKFPNDDFVLASYAECLMSSGKMVEALEEYEKAINIFTDSSVILSGYGHILRKLGKLDAALPIFKTGKRRFPENPFFYSGYAETLKDIGQLTDALNSYKSAMKKFPDEVVFFNGYAEVLRHTGNQSKTYRAYLDAIKKFPDEPAPLNGYAQSLRDFGNLDQALIEFGKSKNRFPRNKYSITAYSDTLRDLGEFKVALDSFKSAIELSPNEIFTHIGYAETLSDMGNLEGALNYYNQIASKFKNEYIVKCKILTILIKLNDHDAIKPYITNLNSNPLTYHDWDIYHKIGMYYLKNSNYQQAKFILTNGMNLAPWLTLKRCFRNSLALWFIDCKEFKNTLKLFSGMQLTLSETVFTTHANAELNLKNLAISQLQFIEKSMNAKIHTCALRLSERYNLNGFEKTGKTIKELADEIFELEFDISSNTSLLEYTIPINNEQLIPQLEY